MPLQELTFLPDDLRSWNQYLRSVGIELLAQSVGTAELENSGVTDEKLRNSAAVSVIGRAANSVGSPADIVAASNDVLLRRVGDVVDFGQLTSGMVPDAVWTYAKIQNATALSVLGRASNTDGVLDEIVAGSDGQVLRRSGTTLGFGALNLADAGTLSGDLPYSSIAQGSALSVLGVTGNAVADLASIVAASDGDVLRRSGTAVGFGQIVETAIADGSVLARVAGTETISGAWTFTPRQTFSADVFISAASPKVIFNETDAGSDAKWWDLVPVAGVLKGRTRTDADGAGKEWLNVTRSGTAITNITFGNATDDNSTTFAGVGTVTFQGPSNLSTANVTGSTVPATGTYRPGTNRLGFSSNTTYRGEFDANGVFITAGGRRVPVVSKTSAYTVAVADEVITVDATSGAVTITLPALSGNLGRWIIVKKIDASGNAVTLDGNASENIDGATTKVLAAQYAHTTIVAGASEWHVIA